MTTKEKKKTKEEATDEINVREPLNLKQELPLVVILPEGASEAQKEFSKTLNAYAYKNPYKWSVKKDGLIAKLKALKNAPPPQDFGIGKLTYTNKLINPK